MEKTFKENHRNIQRFISQVFHLLSSCAKRQPGSRHGKFADVHTFATEKQFTRLHYHANNTSFVSAQDSQTGSILNVNGDPSSSESQRTSSSDRLSLSLSLNGVESLENKDNMETSFKEPLADMERRWKAMKELDKSEQNLGNKDNADTTGSHPIGRPLPSFLPSHQGNQIKLDCACTCDWCNGYVHNTKRSYPTSHHQTLLPESDTKFQEWKETESGKSEHFQEVHQIGFQISRSVSTSTKHDRDVAVESTGATNYHPGVSAQECQYDCWEERKGNDTGMQARQLVEQVRVVKKRRAQEHSRLRRFIVDLYYRVK